MLQLGRRKQASSGATLNQQQQSKMLTDDRPSGLSKKVQYNLRSCILHTAYCQLAYCMEISGSHCTNPLQRNLSRRMISHIIYFSVGPDGKQQQFRQHTKILFGRSKFKVVVTMRIVGFDASLPRPVAFEQNSCLKKKLSRTAGRGREAVLWSRNMHSLVLLVLPRFYFRVVVTIHIIGVDVSLPRLQRKGRELHELLRLEA